MAMAGVGHSQVGPPPTWTQNLCHYSNKATPSRVTSCLKPNLLKTANAHISVRTADTQLAWGSQNQQPPALLKTKTSKSPQVGSPHLETKIRLKTDATFMASVGHQRVGSPPLEPKTIVTQASTATPSRITPCWKPNLLKTASAHILCALPTPSLLRAVKTNSLQLC